MKKFCRLALAAWFIQTGLTESALGADAGTAPSVLARITLVEPPEKDFFSKALDFHGIPIKAHRAVADEALCAAHERLSMMLRHQPMVVSNLVAAGAALHIIGRDQVTTDLPEWRHDKGKPLAEYRGLTRDQRTRGMGGLLTSCGEENLLRLEKDRYRGRDICVHEFAHNIRNHGIPRSVRARFDAQHKRSLEKGLWRKSYAGSNPDEFFAELSMWYFGTRGDLSMTGPKPENGPEGLKKYDPDAYALFDDFYSGRTEITRVEPRPRRRGAEENTKALPDPSAVSAPQVDARPSVSESPQQRSGRPDPGPRRVFRDRIAPHWFQNDSRFWYRNDLRDGAKEFVLVDAERGKREAAFDHGKLAAALSRAAGAEYHADKLPFDSIEYIDDSKAVRFSVGDAVWKCDLTSYECSKTDAGTSPAPPVEADAGSPSEPRRRPGRGERSREDSDNSPDGRWTAFVKEHNLFIKSREGDAKEIQLSPDGKEDLAYGRFSWAPDSKTLVAFRIEPGDRKEVYLVQSSPSGGGRAKLQSRPYALPGDKFTTYELNLFEVPSGKQIKPDVDRFEHGWLAPRLRWKKDGRHFMYQQTDRGHQRFRVIDVDSQTGRSRNLIDEKSDTFIWTAHTENVRMDFVNWLEQTDEIIYASERDGWRHLYLIDAEAGKIKSQITKGEWVVRGIDRIDEERRHIWFNASGRNPDQDPYLIHFYRVSFDGTDLVALTEGNGNHTVQYSPDRRFLIDTWSRVDAPPVNELRRTSDGKLVCPLETADITDLKASGWEPPEVFVAKGRDGRTDIWGILCRPRDFDPNRKYPVVEDIYAGPQGSFVPKTFSSQRRYASLTDLGFIVVKIDGMGTANRSKAFHDVCWHNLKDAGFEDRILWMKAAAKKCPYLDLTRVGVYGNSAGGQNAAAAVLFHPEFYKAAVASCGCHDNRMDKASWNEQWMGYPVGPQYSECSNIDNAHRLQGKLFLIVGEMDTNVPPESTLRFADALIKAGKDFDLLVIPGGGHGMGGAYGQRRMRDFFVRHLLGVEPPDRNAPRAEPSDTGSQ